MERGFITTILHDKEFGDDDDMKTATMMLMLMMMLMVIIFLCCCEVIDLSADLQRVVDLPTNARHYSTRLKKFPATPGGNPRNTG